MFPSALFIVVKTLEITKYSSGVFCQAICISNKIQADADATSSGTTLEELL